MEKQEQDRRFMCWLWPDHVIGKRESRKLREEHNALINSHAELLEALRELLVEYDQHIPEDCGCAKVLTAATMARAAIAKATH